jgi:hypothetical protein
MRIETAYQKKLRIKKLQQLHFRRFVRGMSTPLHLREWIGLNWLETKALIELRMLPGMSWQNYGSYWVIDHVVPFWMFDITDQAELKQLWHPENLFPMIWADNNHKQGDLRFSILFLTRRKGHSAMVEMLIARCEKELKNQDKYLYGI